MTFENRIRIAIRSSLEKATLIGISSRGDDARFRAGVIWCISEHWFGLKEVDTMGRFECFSMMRYDQVGEICVTSEYLEHLREFVDFQALPADPLSATDGGLVCLDHLASLRKAVTIDDTAKNSTTGFLLERGDKWLEMSTFSNLQYESNELIRIEDISSFSFGGPELDLFASCSDATLGTRNPWHIEGVIHAGQVVEVYRSPSAFLLGPVYRCDADHMVLAMVDSGGRFDGFAWIPYENIYRIASGSTYANRLATFATVPEAPVFTSLDLPSVLKSLHGLREFVTIVSNISDRLTDGTIEECGVDYVMLATKGAYAQDLGTSIILLTNIRILEFRGPRSRVL